MGNHWSKTKSWRHLDLVPGNRHSISELFFLSAEYKITKLQTINGTVFPPFLESSPTLWGRLHVFMSQKPRAERRSEYMPTVEASLLSSTSPTSYTNAHIRPLSSDPGQHTPDFYMRTEQICAETRSRPAGGESMIITKGETPPGFWVRLSSVSSSIKKMNCILSKPSRPACSLLSSPQPSSLPPKAPQTRANPTTRIQVLLASSGTLASWTLLHRPHSIFPQIPSCSSPQPFWHQRPVSWKTIFPQAWETGAGFVMIQEHSIYCALYFYLLHQLHLRSSGIRSRKLETPALVSQTQICVAFPHLEVTALVTLCWEPSLTFLPHLCLMSITHTLFHTHSPPTPSLLVCSFCTRSSCICMSVSINKLKIWMRAGSRSTHC